MSGRAFFAGLACAARAVRLFRLAMLVLASLGLALASDWLRAERVIFPAPLPKFTTVPAQP